MNVSKITSKTVLMICFFLSVLFFLTAVLGKTSANSFSTNTYVNNEYPYPPPDEINSVQELDFQPYPAPNLSSLIISEQILEVPIDHLVVVTNKGIIEEINYGSNFGYFIGNDGNSIVFPNPGNSISLQDEINSDEPEIDRVIGEDNRVKISDTTIFPWQAVVKITGSFGEGEPLKCSGWMLGPSTVVTAGHCIYSRKVLRFAYDVTITPGYNGDAVIVKPFGSCSTFTEKVLSPWFLNGDIGYDYGVYELACRIGENTGNLGFRTTSGSGIGIFEALVGYPGDKGSETMWTGGGFITSSDNNSFFYDNDMAGGQSGGPVWVTEPSCNPCVIAINANEFDPPTMNQGSRINQTAFDFFLSEQQFVAQLIYLPIIVR